MLDMPGSETATDRAAAAKRGSPHPLFDPEWYRQSNPDIPAHLATFGHYLSEGWRRLKSPHPLFSIEHYFQQRPDVRGAGVEPLGHFVTQGWKEKSNPHPLFDVEFYLSQEPDLGGADPLTHYATVGRKQGFRPSRGFGYDQDIGRKLESEPFEKPAAVECPDDEPIEVDEIGEKRPANADFDTAWYIENNEDVRAAGVEPYWHYKNFGEAEGRTPNAQFDPFRYLALHGDVRRAGMGAFEHYSKYGWREGRLATAPVESWREGSTTILFVGHDSYAAGAQKVLLEIIKWFTTYTLYNVKILLLGGGHLTSAYGRLADCFTVAENIEDDVAQIRSFLRVPPSVVYCNTVVAGRIFLSSLGASLKDALVVTHCHELERVLSSFPEEFDALRNRANYWICASPAIQDLLRGDKVVGGKPIAVVPAFIEKSNLSVSEQEAFRARHRQRLGLGNETFVVLGCGTLHWRKDPALFLDTAVSVINQVGKSSGRDVAFVWVGDGEEFDELVRRAHSSGLGDRIRFIGRRSDAADFMCVGDLFFLSSQEDPFPLVVLEAAQFGIPAVCFRGATGMEGFIERRGRVIEERSATAAAEIIFQLLENASDDRTEFGKAAQIEVLSRYTSSVQMPNILAHLHNAGLKPGVSIIVPNYNHERYIAERLSSIFNQTFQDFELIILDDCSTDNSIEKLAPFLGDPRARLTINEYNSGGIFKQWARGVGMARSEVVWIAESDDTCAEDFLSILLPHMLSPNINIAFAKTEIIDENGAVVPDALKPYFERFSPGFGEGPFIQSGADFVNAGFGALCVIVNASGVIFRKSAVQKSLRDAMGYGMCGDWRVYLGASVGASIAYNPRALNYFRRHTQSAVHRFEGTDQYFEDRISIAEYVLSSFHTTRSLRRRMQIELTNEASRFQGRFDPAFTPDISRLFKLNQVSDYLEQSIHVCFYVHGLLFSKGGIERLVSLISSGLVDRGYRVSVACRPAKTTAPVFPLRSEVGILPVDIEELKGRALLRKFLVDEDVNIFIPMLSECLFEHAIEAATGLGIPILASEHNNPKAIEERWWSRERRLNYFSRVDAIHLVAPSFKASLPLSLRSKTKIIQHPIACEFATAVRRPATPPRILAAGRLAAQKRFDLLIEAFALLAHEFPEWELFIFGEGELRDELELLLSRWGLAGRAHLPGVTSSLAAEMERAEFFVLSSEFEAVGLVLVEAMATAMPVVAFECCAGADDVVIDGTNGLLARELSAVSLANAMRRMMTDPLLRASCGQQARLKANEFRLDTVIASWDGMVRALVDA